MEPHGKARGSKRRPQGANIPYQRTNSPTGRTRGPLGSGYEAPRPWKHQLVPSLSLPAADGADRSTAFSQTGTGELKYVLD